MGPVAEIWINSLRNLQEQVRELTHGESGFVFRGYYATSDGTADVVPALTTGLERVCGTIDGDLINARKREVVLVREFIRRAHHYLSDLPQIGDSLEWLALMQHHGAPTRLLDWTYSLHVAIHFAVSHATRQAISSDLAVWMVNARWCTDASEKICRASGLLTDAIGLRPLRSSGEERASQQLLWQTLPPSVWAINPFRLNERLTLQRGVFLCPGDPTQSFVKNLIALPGHDRESNLIRFRIPSSELPDISRELHEANVTDATLFPGLDGFARSLWLSARYLSLPPQLESFKDI